jgi:hypothetical protein
MDGDGTQEQSPSATEREPILQATTSVPAIVQPTVESNSKPLLFLSVFLSILAYIFGSLFIKMGEREDWSKIRCQPHIMPFASLYGYNTSDNFNYCMKSSFDIQAKEYLGPVYAIFGGFVGVLSTLVEVSKKIKLSFATMYGGVVTIMQEFTERLKMFFIRIEILSQRMRMMMNRVYTTMFAVIFMALSGLTAVTNFGGTVLFDVIDTFCFDPDTTIVVKNKGMITIRNVQLGDVLSDDSIVTSLFQFNADGQAMVYLPSADQEILVSTNHYLLHDGVWIRADAHPAAVPAAKWNGGNSRPLICLNTTTNCIPISGYVFRDYDETSAAHSAAIELANRQLNGCAAAVIKTSFGEKWHELYPSMAPQTCVALRAATAATAAEIQLGAEMTTGDKVAGTIQHLLTEICHLPTGEQVAAGTLIYDDMLNAWRRAGDMYTVHKVTPTVFHSFITLPGSKIELASGVFLRDYLEIASSDTEAPYSAALAALASAPVNTRLIDNITID